MKTQTCEQSKTYKMFGDGRWKQGAIIYGDDKKHPSMYLYMAAMKLDDTNGINTYVYLLGEQAEEDVVTEHGKWNTEAVCIQHPMIEVRGIKRIVSDTEHLSDEFESMVIEYIERSNISLYDRRR